MEIVFHTGKETASNPCASSLKNAEFLVRELRTLAQKELKALLSTLKDNRTFEQK